MKSIGIIGAGFSGTMCAVNILKNTKVPVKIYLIDKNLPGRGIAYSENDLSYLLNVRADQMGAFAEDPAHFYKWLKEKQIDVEPTSLMPRSLYGNYLREVLQQHQSSSLEIIQDTVIDIDDKNRSIILEKNKVLQVDAVILANGLNAKTTTDLEKYRDSKENLVIVGTGLTMVDTVVYLQKINYRGKITAVSRHGRLPAHHIFYPATVARPVFDFSKEHSLLFVLNSIKEHLKKYEWRLVIDALRPHNQFLWSQFSQTEKSQFLRYCRNLWDVHRHRMSPAHKTLLDDLMAYDKLEIKAIGYRGPRPSGKNIIELTGLSVDETSANQLMNHLFSKKIIEKDEFNLGLKTDEHGNVYRNWIFTLGPLRRGELWECTAVPEIRVQAKELAQYIFTKI